MGGKNEQGDPCWSELKPCILVVDDEVMVRKQLERLYMQDGFRVSTAPSAEEALEYLSGGEIDLVVTDIRLPGMDGVQLIARMKEICPDVPVIAITGYRDIETAVEVLKQGARDFIVKPFSAPAIQQSTWAALEKMRVFMEIRHLRRSLNDSGEFGGILSKTAEMHRVFEIIRLVAPTDMTVLVEGETGTGKELVANAIHYHSPRRDGPFITINCAGFPESLLESELFGHERGAFTGAEQSRAGKVELAHGGTLFLDEIESISTVMQGKLLRVLEDQKVQRLGSSRSIQIDMRVITATNVPLDDLVAQGRMRSDFYYRINVVPIYLIPLRERREDISLLVQDFLHHHPVAVQKGITGMSQKVMNQLMQYSWPGNIRELQNALERAIALTTDRVIEKVNLPKSVSRVHEDQNIATPDFSLSQWLQAQEKQYLTQRLKAFGGRVDLTANACQIGERTLSRKIRFYGLDRKTLRQKAPERGDLPVWVPPSKRPVNPEQTSH
ncbi:MAG: sigma-54-dependent Fis family transcriptional regulator [Deltaproteobacteria bacterium]|nr:sigma-54-dependent Fis family transcriptional regulator [Deltaproteobacteria bacterium]